MLRDFNYAIVDEVDSVLIDEARTPIIISGSAGKDSSISESLYLASCLSARRHVAENSPSCESLPSHGARRMQLSKFVWPSRPADECGEISGHIQAIFSSSRGNRGNRADGYL